MLRLGFSTPQVRTISGGTEPGEMLGLGFSTPQVRTSSGGTEPGEMLGLGFSTPPVRTRSKSAPIFGVGSSGSVSPWEVPTCQHVLVGIVGDGEDVGRSFTPLLAPVGSHHLGVVDRQPLVGVDSHAEEP